MVLYVYDGVWMYLTLLDEMYNEGGHNFRNGQNLFNKVRNRTFDSLGMCYELKQPFLYQKLN